MADSHASQVNVCNCVAAAPDSINTRGPASSGVFVRLIRQGFSHEEWSRLSTQPAFLARVNLAASIDEAEILMRLGTELIEGNLPRPDSLPLQIPPVG
jgi:hypothetical protein